jgi:phage replication O-like protein O
LRPDVANPQPEPFVQFSKELFDAILRAPMPATQQRIVLAIVRRTYGDFGKREAPVSVGLLGKMLGQNKGTVSRALTDLIDHGVIVVVREERHRTTRILALHKDYEAWGSYSVRPDDVPTTVAWEQPKGCLGATQRLPGSNPKVAWEQP